VISIKKSNYFFNIFLIFIFINLFLIKDIKYIIIDSCNLWFNNLFPVIFPFYIISDLLINYGFLNIIEMLLKYSKLKINPSSFFILIFSMLTGFPSGAKYIAKLLKEDLISTEEANRVIAFSHFSNPLFIINVIGITILENKLLGYFILISHFLSNIIIALLLRKNVKYSKQKLKSNQLPLGSIISTSIMNTINSLLIILGNIISFQLLIKIIFTYINVPANLQVFINLLFEITSGLFKLKYCNLNLITKAFIITFSLSFGGLCIHSQVYSILSETKVKYKNYLLGRILQAFISILILLIITLFHRI